MRTVFDYLGDADLAGAPAGAADRLDRFLEVVLDEPDASRDGARAV
jgi:hypothetical protein